MIIKAIQATETLHHHNFGLNQGSFAPAVAKTTLMRDVIMIGHFNVKPGKGNVAIFAKPGLVFAVNFQEFIYV